MRKMTLQELINRKPNRLDLATRFNRRTAVRRKPRSTEEMAVLGEIVVRRVKAAMEAGDIIRDGKRIKIRIRTANSRSQTRAK